MGWTPVPLSITKIDVAQVGTSLDLIIQGTAFAKGEDVFLVHKLATAVELIVSLTEGKKESPDKGVIRATKVTLQNPTTITCTASIEHAKKGAYFLVVDQVQAGLLEVAISEKSIDI